MTEQDYSPGRPLTEYPRPSLAVDIAAFTYSREVNQLFVLVITDDKGNLRLPGSFVREEERLSEAVARTMAVKVGMKTQRPTLLDIFDEPGRDPRGWVITAAHLLVVPEDESQQINRQKAKWVPVHTIGSLAGDHDEIVDVALEKLRKEYEIDQTLVKDGGVSSSIARENYRSLYMDALDGDGPDPSFFETMNPSKIPRKVYAGKPDPEGFFARPFTLRELQTLHETVAGRPFLSASKSLLVNVNYSAPSNSLKPTGTGSLRDTFRRLMEPQLDEAGTNENHSSRGAPSRTWRIKD